MTNEHLFEALKIFTTGKRGIECLVCEGAPETVINRLATLDKDPLSKVQLNQLLGLREERGMSDDFFRYYWLAAPDAPYKLSTIPGFSSEFAKHDKIQDLGHLIYGLYRIFVDGLLYKGTSVDTIESLRCNPTRRLINSYAAISSIRRLSKREVLLSR
jgi:hypothetical protein